MVQSAPVSVTKKAIQSKAEQFSTCMYVLCMCMYLFACERVLLAGVDVGWLCWARLVFYLLVFYLLELLYLLDLLVFYLLLWTWAGCAGQGWCST